jgi:hypothetical protein
METLNLTDEMRAEIANLSERFDVPAEIILRRMVFSYAAKFEKQQTPVGENVVPIRGETNG